MTTKEGQGKVLERKQDRKDFVFKEKVKLVVWIIKLLFVKIVLAGITQIILHLLK